MKRVERGSDAAMPTKDKAHVASVGQVGSNESERLHFLSATNYAQADADRKLIASLQAEFALRGHALDLLDDGSMLLSRWGWTRPVSTLAEARHLLARIRGGAA